MSNTKAERAYQRAYYHAHKHEAKYSESRRNSIERQADANTKRRQTRRSMIDAFKDVPCADCGVKYPPYIMDFDHRNPDEKLFQIGSNSTLSIERILTEISKCDVVCSNCHRERTWGQ